MEFLSRTKELIGEKSLEKFINSNIIVFGIGGVGGYVVEMLVRTGIKNITIVDFDKIDVTNINRQIIANHTNIGKFKTKVAKERIVDINPNCEVINLNERVTTENINEFNLKKYDYVVDCIDSVPDKMAIIEYCYKNNINIISSMGTGNKTGIPNYIISDIYKTEYDKLAKVIRKKCKELSINKLTVCYSKEMPIIKDKVFSIAYQPACCGIMIASYLINELIKE